jgi:hypothetical protein
MVSSGLTRNRPLQAVPASQKTGMYSSDTKICARQIVREYLDDILAGTFEIPSLEDMELVLKRNFDHAFDEYKFRQKIKRSHLEWTEEQVTDELERRKRHYENELRVNLRVAALNTISEVENLIKSLNQAVREWKIKNL